MSLLEEQPDPIIAYVRLTEFLLESWRLLGRITLNARIGVNLTHEEDIASSLAEYRIDLGETTLEPIEDLLKTHDICYLPADTIVAAPQIRRTLAKLTPGQAQLTLLEALLTDAFPQHPALDSIHPITGRPDTYLLQTPRNRITFRHKTHENTTQLLHMQRNDPQKTPKRDTENPEKTPKPEKEPENHPYERILLKKPIVTTTYEIMTLWH